MEDYREAVQFRNALDDEEWEFLKRRCLTFFSRTNRKYADFHKLRGTQRKIKSLAGSWERAAYLAGILDGYQEGNAPETMTHSASAT